MSALDLFTATEGLSSESEQNTVLSLFDASPKRSGPRASCKSLFDVAIIAEDEAAPMDVDLECPQSQPFLPIGPIDVEDKPDQLVGGQLRGRGRPHPPWPRPANAAEVSDAAVDLQMLRMIRNRQHRWAKAAEQTQDSQGQGDRSVANDNLVQKIRDIATTLFTSDVLRGARSHTAGLFGVTVGTMMDTVTRLAAVAVDSQDKVSLGVIQSLLEASAASGDKVKPHLFMRVRQYDETPIMLRTERKGKDKEAANSKLFVTEARWSALFIAGDQCEQGSFHIESQVRTPLQVLASNSAACIASALRQTTGHEYDLLVNDTFARVLSVVTTDDLSANHSAERELGQQEASSFPNREFGKLHLSCDVHKAHGVAKSMFDLLPYFTSGLIKSALVLRGGLMPEFRALFKQVLQEQFRVYRGRPEDFGVSPEVHRNWMIETFFSDCSDVDKDLLRRLLNGNWMMSGVGGCVVMSCQLLPRQSGFGLAACSFFNIKRVFSAPVFRGPWFR